MKDQTVWPRAFVRLPRPFDGMTGHDNTDTNIISLQVPMTQALGKARSDNGRNRFAHYDVGDGSLLRYEAGTDDREGGDHGGFADPLSLSLTTLSQRLSLQSVSLTLAFPGSQLFSITHAHNALLGR